MKRSLKKPERDEEPPDGVETFIGSDSVETFTFGEFRLDAVKRRLHRGNDIVALPSKALDTLLVLIEGRDRVVDKDELLRRVWPNTFVTEDSLAQSVSVLRHALGDDPAQPEFVVTVPRRGYRFIASITSGSIQASGVPHAQTSIVASPSTVAPQDAPVARRWPGVTMPLLAAAVVAGTLVGWIAVSLNQPSVPATSPLNFIEPAPAGATIVPGGVVSPDGRSLAFVARDSGPGRNHLWVRSLDATEPKQLPGTDGASLPFWSPDSHSLGFFVDRWVNTIDLGSNVVQRLATVLLVPMGGSWNRDGLILYGMRNSPLTVVSSSGTDGRPATVLDRAGQETAHYVPQFLPDGRHFLYFVVSANPERSGTYVGSLDSSDKRRLLDASHTAVVFAAGYLLYVRNHMVMAQPFDASTLKLTGAAIPVGIRMPPWASDAMTISASDKLLALSGAPAHDELRWFDKAGRALKAIDSPAALHTPALSRDQTQLVASSTESGLAGIWVVDLVRGSSNRIVTDGIGPFWSPGGDRIAYTSTRLTGVLDIYIKTIGAQEPDSLILKTDRVKGVTDWSRDGRYIVFNTSNQQNVDIWLLDVTTAQPMPLLQTGSNEMHGRISPSGRWIAYASDETGRWEVYLQSFPVPSVKHAVSILGGTQPSWREDGQELFFLSSDGVVTAVDVTSDPLTLGPPRPLFRAPVSNDLLKRRNSYLATADGQRFLVDTVDGTGGGIVTTVDWQAAIRR